MDHDIYLPDEIYYQLIEALTELKPDPAGPDQGRSALKTVLGLVGQVWPAWVEGEQCDAG